MKKKILIFSILFSTIVCAQNAITNDGAIIHVQESGLVYAQGTVFSSNDGVIEGHGQLQATTITNQSKITVSDDTEIGLLNITGDVINDPTSEINLKVKGAQGAGFQIGNDAIVIDGDLTLDNTLNVSFLNFFNPNPTDEFTLITYTGNLTNTFQQVNLPDNFTGFQIDYNTPGEIILKGVVLSVDNFDLNSISIFPNPVTDIINIKYDKKIEEIIIFDILGKIVLNPTLTNDKINVSTLSSGLYLLSIQTNGVKVTKKIIIN